MIAPCSARVREARSSAVRTRGWAPERREDEPSPKSPGRPDSPCANARFLRRFQAMEAMAGGSVEGKSVQEMLELWAKAKVEAG